MYRYITAATLAAALMLSPLPLLIQDAAGQTAQSAPAAKTEAKKPPSAGQLALRERQKKCGAEWRETKKAGKVEKGMKWPQYWSACNKRLKAAR
jgi:hypothetical protein